MGNTKNIKDKSLNDNVKEENISIVKVPNQRLIKALEEVEAIETGKIEAKRYKSFEEIINDLA